MNTENETPVAERRYIGLQPVIKRNDKMARSVIWIFSIVIFLTITALGRIKLEPPVAFDIHVFARVNAFINTAVFVLLIAGLLAVKFRRYRLHKRIMISALVLSALSLAGALFLILDLDQPFRGIIRIPSAPMFKLLHELEK